jgi:hypothetical protein
MMEGNMGSHGPETVPRIFVHRILWKEHHYIFPTPFQSQSGKFCKKMWHKQHIRTDKLYGLLMHFFFTLYW